jgi:hypothetical protein
MDNLLYLNDEPDSSVSLSDLIRSSLGVPVFNNAEAVCVLALLAGSVSYEEIYSVFGTIPKIFYKKVFPKLIKEGVVERVRFDRPDGACVSYFKLTAKGYSQTKDILSMLPVVPKRDRQKMGVHSYAIGYNLYQLVRLSHPFIWVAEAPYDNPLKEDLSWRSDLSYRTDCNAIFTRDNTSYRIVHIEEDRAMEHVDELLGKLYNYYKKGCFSNSDETLVFSIRAAGVSVPDVSVYGRAKDYLYSSKYLNDLIRCMEDGGMDDAAVLIGHPDVFNRQEYLTALLNRASSVTDCVDLAYLKSLQGELDGGMGISRMQMQDFNAQHQAVSLNILNGLMTPFKRLFDIAEADQLSLLLIKGRAVGVLPTSLLSSRLPYLMLSDFDEYVSRVSSFLSLYYGEVVFEGETGPALLFGDYKNRLVMRNAFRHGSGHVFVEFPMMDMASWVRCCLYSKYMGTFPDISQVVCVFDTREEAEKFFSVCGYDAKQLYFDKGSCGMYGMLFDDLRRSDRDGIFLASGEGDRRYLIGIPPSIES